MAGISFTAPKRFISHRWLCAYDNWVATYRLFDLHNFLFSIFPMGKARKERIIIDFFVNHEMTLLLIYFYQRSMFSLKTFLEKYQRDVPQIHFQNYYIVHSDQLDVARNFLVKFIQAKFFEGKNGEWLMILFLIMRKWALMLKKKL